MAITAIGSLTTDQMQAFLDGVEPVVVLQPLGSIEPHGPHLPLETDATISEAACERAASQLSDAGFVVLLAPTIPYGVTDCAAGFAGAVSVAASALIAYLQATIQAYLNTGVDHVCLVNNHLEPDHDTAVRSALDGFDVSAASVACPLTRRWARTLSDEFKSGECHAGQYETSILMAANPNAVNEQSRMALPAVPISLAVKLREGVTDFKDMGLMHAYCGSPSSATAAEGDDMLNRLATMIATEVGTRLRRTAEMLRAVTSLLPLYLP